MEFNPTVKDFLEKKQDVTVIGLYWAGLWRLYAAMLIISLLLVGLGEVLK
jgi:hypothetical protein